MTITKFYKISGRVQGVFYRSSTEKMAKSMKIRGWVKNCPDGTVECLATAPIEVLESFEKWLWKGPIAAKVTQVEVTDLKFQEFDNFSVKG